ncbi:MAG: TonB-dependent receptor domain-containing protein [Myxococcota bacterium]
MRPVVLIGLLIEMAVSPHAWAQEVPAQPEASTEPIRVPARLVSPATPVYPPDALPELLSGEVVLHVTVAVDGSVTDVAYASGGPEVFVAPALEAARTLRFEPATRDGHPVVSRIAVTFHFEPPVEAPPPDEETIEELEIREVIPLAERETHAVTTMGELELERAGGEDLGETIAEVPGVAVARGNGANTKPIIRGQFERRLLVLFDGVRHESQKWGLDHATEIDPFAAGEIVVVKGAAGVRYGPDAIGGVILVDPPPMRADAGVGGKAQLVGVTNGPGGVAAARVDGAPLALPGFAFRVEGNYARGAAIRTPTYVLGNTASEAWNAGATLGLSRGHLSMEAAWRHYALRSGVCYCVRSGSPDDFLAQLDADTPIGAENWSTTFKFDRPYQSVTHDLALARAVVTLGGADLTATYAFQANLRQEYEQTRATIAGPQYDFTLRTHSLDALLDHGEAALGAIGALEGGVGLAGTFQENIYRGVPLIPNFRALQGGLYAFERLKTGLVAVEAGARYDHLSRDAFLTQSAFDRSVARGTLTGDDCAVEADAARCPAAWDAASVSLGGLWRAIPDRLEARLDLSSASRFPNADELYMNGSAPTFPVYALGDPSLGPETTWGASPTLGLRLPWIEAEASTYLNFIDDYVYFAPEIGADGEPVVDVTIEGAFPRFSYRPIAALFYGLDGGVTLGPEAVVGLVLQGAAVRAVDTGTGSPLVMIPSDRVQASVRLSPPGLGPFEETFAEVTGHYVFEQTHVDAGADLAPPPDAYFLLDAALGAQVPVGARTLKVGVEAHNVLDARYRDYTSLLRYFADEPGREVRLRVGLEF